MPLWKKPVDLDALQQLQRNTLMEALGIRITAVEDDALFGTMPVDARTRQPFGLLHGGASAALAETLGSAAAHLATPPGTIAMGLEISAHHLKAVREGIVTGCARPLHLGRTTQLWDIRIQNAADQLVCSARLTVLVREIP